MVKFSSWVENEFDLIRNLTSTVNVPEVPKSETDENFDEYSISTISDKKSNTLADNDYYYYDY